MLNRRMSLMASAMAIATVCTNNYALCQSPVEERISIINWERAESDVKQTLAIPAFKALRETHETELSSIRLPVLIPNPAVVESPPRLRGQGNSYAAAYALTGAKLSVLGTSVFLVRPDDQASSQSATGNARNFDRSDDGSDLSFLKYGASYVLRLSCSNVDDERCSKDVFLNSVADSLAVIGGAK
jgi:hypothetical protein